MAIFHRVRAVPGRLVVHPESVGADTRIIGHQKHIDGASYPRGVNAALPNNGAVPKRTWQHDPEPVVVWETREGYIRTQVLEGDLDYLASAVADNFEALEHARWYVDATLAEASARQVRRGPDAAQQPAQPPAAPTTHAQGLLPAASQASGGSTVPEAAPAAPQPVAPSPPTAAAAPQAPAADQTPTPRA